MAVSCKRVGCRVPASTSLLIDAGAATVTLVDVETAPVGVTLCALHVASVSAPVRWSLVDARDANLRLLTVEAQAPSPPPAARPDAAAGGEAAAPEAAEAAAGEAAEAAEVPVEVAVAVEVPAAPGSEAPSAPAPPAAEELFPWLHHFDEEDEPKALNASSPLLSRAFRAAV